MLTFTEITIRQNVLLEIHFSTNSEKILMVMKKSTCTIFVWTRPAIGESLRVSLMLGESLRGLKDKCVKGGWNGTSNIGLCSKNLKYS